MKKFIRYYLTALILLTAVLMNGCDIFESFQFGLPISVEIDSQGVTNPFGSASFCLDTDKTYQKYQDDINSINFVAAYIVTLEVNPATITGNAILRLYEGTNSSGKLLFEHTAANITPAAHDSSNAYKVELTADQISAINQSLALADNNKCFYGEYLVQITSGQGVTNSVKVRVDALFNVDAKL